MTVKGDLDEPEIPIYTANPVQVTQDPIMTAGAPVATAVALEPEPKAPATVDVIAPTNMAAGYQFNVDAGGKMMRVAVPPGGALAGQRFAAIIISETAMGGAAENPHNIPSGSWRDDLCDCCKFGCCHAQCCLAYWCTTCAMGQLMTRLKLNWMASPLGSVTPSMSTFRVVFIITCVYIVLNWITGGIVQANDEDEDVYTTSDGEEGYVVAVAVIRDVLGLAFAIYALVIICKTRAHVRNKYNIPTKCCGDCEDCCCSFWCAPCTTCQIARHITDYNTYSASCCSDNGLHPATPDIV